MPGNTAPARATTQPSRNPALTVLAATALPVGIACLVLFFFDPRRYHFYPTCFFHQSTGLLCAGCGCLRAVHQLLHGHLVSAFRFNPLLIVSLPFILWFGGRQVLQKVRNEPARPRIRAVWWWLLLASLLTFTVLRNVPGMPFSTLPK
jgi:Protein of unknown function (DUF2752)